MVVVPMGELGAPALDSSWPVGAFCAHEKVTHNPASPTIADNQQIFLITVYP